MIHSASLLSNDDSSGFFKRNPSIEVFSAFIMSRYLSAEYTDRRASGATLMTSFPDLIKFN